MKVLITGASGYLGGFIVERLRLPHELTLFNCVEPAQSDRLRYVHGDVTSYTDVENVCAGQDAVVHLVALVHERYDKPHTLFADVRVKGTWNVAEACVKQGMKRLVNVSSIIAIGMVCPGVVGTTLMNPKRAARPDWLAPKTVAAAVLHAVAAPENINVFDTILFPTAQKPW